MKTSIMIEKVDFYSTDSKTKQPLMTRFGKPYIKARIMNGSKAIYVNVFNPEQKALFIVGRPVELEVEQNGQFMNYSLPKPKTPEQEKLEELENRIIALERFNGLMTPKHPEIGGHVEEKADDEIDVEQLPF